MLDEMLKERLDTLAARQVERQKRALKDAVYEACNWGLTSEADKALEDLVAAMTPEWAEAAISKLQSEVIARLTADS